jgi:D-alanyl-lipoteichoic acid acyltransferase DltB (MBOAT superfamily)
MDFTTLKFLIFLVVAALAYNAVPRRLRVLVLLVCSCIFYYTNSHGLLLLLAGDSALVFAAALLLPKVSSPRLRLTIVSGTGALLVAILVLFKSAVLLPGVWARSLLMPLGVSYYTFKLLGYLIDVYWEATEPEKNFLNFAAFVSFFPQIVAGPIERSEEFLPQIHSPGRASRAGTLLGVQRILLGFFKKFVVADNIATLVNFIYAHLHSIKMPVFLAFYGYPLQMYADFSALTDISIGAALFFGIAAPENFEAPFSAASPSEYWRRWHITLTKWLTDYVFTPLRMATRKFGNYGLVFSLTVNMVLIGLWHGFRWTFVIFGLVHALYLSIDALTMKARREYYKRRPGAKKLAGFFGPVSTFHLVALAFVCFRAPAAGDIIYIIRNLFSTAAAWPPQFQEFMDASGRAILTGLLGYGVAECFDWLRRRNATLAMVGSMPRWGRWSVYSCTAIAVCFLAMLLLVGGEKRSPFLYAIF